MPAKLYLETTIPSYLVGWPSRDLLVAAHQQVTREWWESQRAQFDVYISELVLIEARVGDAALAGRRLEVLAGIPLVPITREILELAEELMADGPIPRKAAGDAAHIAAATIHRCEYLLTWNCRHIANTKMYEALQRVIGRHGYGAPKMCTPEELLGEEEL